MVLQYEIKMINGKKKGDARQVYFKYHLSDKIELVSGCSETTLLEPFHRIPRKTSGDI